MRPVLFTLADYANVGEKGKLNVMGVFDSIMAKRFPVRHQAMVLVLRLLFEYEDSENEREVRVTLEGPDGGKILEIDGKIRVGTMAPGHFRTQNAMFNLKNVEFPRSGTYMFRAFIDGEPVGELPLRLAQTG